MVVLKHGKSCSLALENSCFIVLDENFYHPSTTQLGANRTYLPPSPFTAQVLCTQERISVALNGDTRPSNNRQVKFVL